MRFLCAGLLKLLPGAVIRRYCLPLLAAQPGQLRRAAVRERFPCTRQAEVYGIVGMFAPIVDDQPLVIVPIDPTAFHERLYQRRGIAAIVQTEGDVIIRQFADISPRSFSRR